MKLLFTLGQAYKRAGGANGGDDLMIEFDANGDGVINDALYDYNTLYTGAERMTKNQWALSTKDSMIQTFQRIEANFESGWNIPREPQPPARFSVTSGTDQIFLEWEAYPGESPAGGWELWRAQNRFDGLPLDPKTGELRLKTGQPCTNKLVPSVLARPALRTMTLSAGLTTTTICKPLGPCKYGQYRTHANGHAA